MDRAVDRAGRYGCGETVVRNGVIEKCLRGMHDTQDEETCEAKRPPAVWVPSQAEVIKHNLTHVPFRNWGRHCVRGRAVNAPHLSKKRVEGDIPVISVDYFLPAHFQIGSEPVR